MINTFQRIMLIIKAVWNALLGKYEDPSEHLAGPKDDDGGFDLGRVPKQPHPQRGDTDIRLKEDELDAL